MTEPMKPADVPQAFVDACNTAINAAYKACPPGEALGMDDGVRIMLAAVLPPHEQQVRQAIAAELAKLTTPCGTHRDRSAFDTGCASCQRHTALLGAKRLVLGQERPS